MRISTFFYEMKLTFSQEAQEHSFTLKCVPQSDERQEITNRKIVLEPRTSYEEAKDTFGNSYLYGKIIQPHRQLQVTVSGQAKTGLQPYVTGEEDRLALYRAMDAYTRPGHRIREMFSDCYVGDQNDLQTAIYMMHQLHRRFTYQPGVTGEPVTAEEALELGAGSCQDYSHILISFCRMAGIPARYVTGLLEGKSSAHAWVEVFYNGGWYGLDPVNDRVVTDLGIVISHGRNYADCILTRNEYLGEGQLSQQEQVTIQNMTEKNGRD